MKNEDFYPAKSEAAQYLARLRWSLPSADRDQPRRVGRLGGRPVTCSCGSCPKCRRRWKRNGRKLTSLFGKKVMD